MWVLLWFALSRNKSADFTLSIDPTGRVNVTTVNAKNSNISLVKLLTFFFFFFFRNQFIKVPQQESWGRTFLRISG